MMPLDQVRGAASTLKVFPLPSAVLFPGTALPLHIFEPRYRELVRDALASDRVVALGDFEPGWERDYGGRPPMRPLACAGVLVWNEALPDGRYNVVLHGLARVRLLEELPPTHLYREVRAEVLEEAAYQGPLEEMLRQAVLEIAGRVDEGSAQNLVQLAVRNSGGALADVEAGALFADEEQRRALLEELNPEARLQQVLDGLTEIIARMGPAIPSGPPN
ncbi:MAG: LON peptidase substrate-binding domain-containing protein [Myxococcaceae bacterium]